MNAEKIRFARMMMQSATLLARVLNEQRDLSGLTKQQLDDGLYALTATIRGDVTAAYAALVQLAARG